MTKTLITLCESSGCFLVMGIGSRIESIRSGQMGCNPSTQAGKAKDHKFKASLGHIVSSSQLVVRAFSKNSMKAQPAL